MIEPFLVALGAQFDAEVTANGDERIVLHFLDRQRLEMDFRWDRKEVDVVTPVEGSHDGLPAPICRELLHKNYPGNDTAGAMLRKRRNQDYLELANALPLAAVTPDQLASLAHNQVVAATALRDELVRLTEQYLSTDGSAEGG